MAKVGQISIARPGFPLQLKFDESELKSTLELEAQPGDHVTLYPGDYRTWYEGAEAGQTTSIEIREGVNVTILPGAKVKYTDEFRNRNFAHSEEPFDSKSESGDPNHPLNPDSNSFPPQGDESLSSRRYEVPNFTGHVENIVDMNFGSEWAFESDLKNLQDRFNEAVGEGRNTIAVTSSSQTNSSPLKLGDRLEFVEKDSVDIFTEQIPEDEDGEGVRVNIEFDKNSVSSINAGRNLTANRSAGEVTIDHEQIIPSGQTENSGAEVIQSLFFDNGHVDEVDTTTVATLESREPRNTDGEDGDIWLINGGTFTLDLFLSSSDPSQFEGSEGDLWVVANKFESEFRTASTFYLSENAPGANTPDIANGSVWLDVPFSLDPDPEDIGVKDKISYQTYSPVASDGNNGDIRATKT